jgi:hypothetical protein
MRGKKEDHVFSPPLNDGIAAIHLAPSDFKVMEEYKL